jgi:hypothetical protein
VIACRAGEGKTVLLKDLDERLVGNGDDLRH